MAPRLTVVHFQWTEGGFVRQETYGPWECRDDDSHMGEIAAFLKDWHRITGREVVSAVLALVMDPEQFAEEAAEREQVAAAMASAGLMGITEALERCGLPPSFPG